MFTIRLFHLIGVGAVVLKETSVLGIFSTVFAVMWNFSGCSWSRRLQHFMLTSMSRLATMHRAQRLSHRLARSNLLALSHRSHAATTPACLSPNPTHTSFCHARSLSPCGTGIEYPEGAGSEKSFHDVIACRWSPDQGRRNSMASQHKKLRTTAEECKHVKNERTNPSAEFRSLCHGGQLDPWRLLPRENRSQPSTVRSGFLHTPFIVGHECSSFSRSVCDDLLVEVS